MVVNLWKWRWVVARVCITPNCEGLPQKDRQPPGCRSFGPPPGRPAVLTKAREALLYR
jgi:hypothetical protein